MQGIPTWVFFTSDEVKSWATFAQPMSHPLQFFERLASVVLQHHHHDLAITEQASDGVEWWSERVNLFPLYSKKVVGVFASACTCLLDLHNLPRFCTERRQWGTSAGPLLCILNVQRMGKEVCFLSVLTRQNTPWRGRGLFYVLGTAALFLTGRVGSVWVPGAQYNARWHMPI